MSDNGVVWQEPPNRLGQSKPGIWVKRLSPLMAQPGRWALVHSCSTGNSARSMGQALKRGGTRAPEGRWEFTVRKTDIYARYLGPEDGEVS